MKSYSLEICISANHWAIQATVTLGRSKCSNFEMFLDHSSSLHAAGDLWERNSLQMQREQVLPFTVYSDQTHANTRVGFTCHIKLLCKIYQHTLNSQYTPPALSCSFLTGIINQSINQ